MRNESKKEEFVSNIFSSRKKKREKTYESER